MARDLRTAAHLPARAASLVGVAVVALAACTAVPVSNPLARRGPPPSVAPGERWDPVAVCGTVFQRYESTVGTGDDRALEMVVLGDSILWGQGLLEQQKASTIVQYRLAEKSGHPVRKRVYAHSGATVAQFGRDLNVAHGEVPSSSPDIALQAECVPNPGKVDVILVNGCINDVDASILFDPTTDAQDIGIEKLCEERCREPMRLLLTRIGKRFPNATIVVPGYYPFFSPQTPDPTLRFVSRLFLLIAKTRGKRHEWAESRHHMLAKSAAWQEISDRMLQEAVERAGAEKDVSGRVVFAPVPFQPENAYGATDSLLWRITEHDAVAMSRWWQCRARPNILERMRCINASAFHPNPGGAAVYAEAILRALESSTERFRRASDASEPGG